jgi:hypothetical protein
VSPLLLEFRVCVELHFSHHTGDLTHSSVIIVLGFSFFPLQLGSRQHFLSKYNVLVNLRPSHAPFPGFILILRVVVHLGIRGRKSLGFRNFKKVNRVYCSPQ